MTLAEYAEARAKLLNDITEFLSADARCMAAWLVGSFGRDEADAVSDLDLQIVISDLDTTVLCARPWMVAGRTVPVRLDLFSQFGAPAIIHENHYNAPGSGTMTHVTYRATALVVDWTLLPLAEAVRPADSRLLLDKVGIPLAKLTEPESLDERQQQIEERIAFFWMMVMVTAKVLIRDEEVKFLSFLSLLHNLICETQRLAEGHPRKYQPDASVELVIGREQQAAALRDACSRMAVLMDQAKSGGFQIVPAPRATVEQLLAAAAEV